MDGLLEVLKNPKSEARAVAAEKLGAAGDSGAVPALAAVSAEQKASDQVRAQALKSLGKLGGAQAGLHLALKFSGSLNGQQAL